MFLKIDSTLKALIWHHHYAIWYAVSQITISHCPPLQGTITAGHTQKIGRHTPSLPHAIPTELILGLRPANERRRYEVTPSLIGKAQTRISPVPSIKADHFQSQGGRPCTRDVGNDWLQFRDILPNLIGQFELRRLTSKDALWKTTRKHASRWMERY